MGHPAADVFLGQVTAYFNIASMAWTVYDTLLNFDDEVELIWRGAKPWIKLVYLMVRHLPYLVEAALVALIEDLVWTRVQCRVWLIFQTISWEALILTLEIILVLRVNAMYNQNRVIIGILTTMLLTELGATIGVLANTLLKFQTEEGGCLVTVTPKLFPYMWLIPLIFETTLFILTLVKFVNSVARQRFVGGRQSIMFILMRDGTWAYGMIFVIMLLNTTFYTVEHNPLSGVCFVLQISLLSFAGSHLLLNTRRLALHPDGTSFWTNNFTSAIEFEPHSTNIASGIDDVHVDTLELNSVSQATHSSHTLKPSIVDLVGSESV